MADSVQRRKCHESVRSNSRKKNKEKKMAELTELARKSSAKKRVKRTQNSVSVHSFQETTVTPKTVNTAKTPPVEKTLKKTSKKSPNKRSAVSRNVGGPTGSDKKKDKDPKRTNVETYVAVTLKKGVTGLRKDFVQNRRVYDMEKCTVFLRNQNKNRYKDVGCLDTTRVVLKEQEGDGYIHASYVGTLKNPKRFICAQAPMDNTQGDFWLMCWQEQVQMIVMLCNIMEKGMKKCAEYYPTESGATKTFGLISVNKQAEENFTFASPTNVKVLCSYLKITKEGDPHTIMCTHYHWIDWPDRGVPTADLAPIELLEEIQETTAPIVVHCSAGIGRTGSIVLLQSIMERFHDGKNFEDTEKLMLKMREGRANSVQTDHQYLYVNAVLLYYFREKTKYLDASLHPVIDKFTEEYLKVVGVPC